MPRAFEIQRGRGMGNMNGGRDRSRSPGSADPGISEAEKQMHGQNWIPEHSFFPQPLFLVNQFVFHWGRKWQWKWKWIWGDTARALTLNGLTSCYFRDSFQKSWALSGAIGDVLPSPVGAQGDAEVWKAAARGRCSPRRALVWKMVLGWSNGAVINGAGMIRQCRSWGRWDNPWPCCWGEKQQWPGRWWCPCACPQLPAAVPAHGGNRTAHSVCFPPKKPPQIQETACHSWYEFLVILLGKNDSHTVLGALHSSPSESLWAPSRASLAIWKSSDIPQVALPLPAVPSFPSGMELGCQELWGQIPMAGIWVRCSSTEVFQWLGVKYLHVDEAQILTQRVPDTGKYLWSAILSGGIIIPFPFALQFVWQLQSRIHNTDTEPNCQWHFHVWEILNLTGKLWKLRSRQWKCKPQSYYSRQTLKSHFVWPLLACNWGQLRAGRMGKNENPQNFLQTEETYARQSKKNKIITHMW